MGKGPSIDDLDIEIVFNLFWRDVNKNISYDEKMEDWYDQDNKSLMPRSSSPEKIIIEKEDFCNLSEEAKDVLNIIFNSPPEILETFIPKRGPAKKNKFVRYLMREKKWGRKFVENIFSELKIFAQGFSG